MNPTFSRRNFLALAGGAVVAAPVARILADGVPPEAAIAQAGPAPAVVTPNGLPLTGRWVDGVRVYHLWAEPVTHEFAPGLKAECWGYNGRVHGPTLEAVSGDRVRIYVTNRLAEPTTAHWHGMTVPNGMDGVAGLTQAPIPPGATFVYEFTVMEAGTFMYHPHHDEMTQMQLGMMGLFVVHPKRPAGPPPDRDYALLLSEWKIEVGARRPDPSEMTDFNVFTINGRAYPGTDPLVARKGDRVRIRIGNLSSMSHHIMHLHGHRFRVVATDGGDVPESARWPETSVLVPTGTTRTIEVVADWPGDWIFHCHMLHHAMNQMGHSFGNWIGVRTEGLDAAVGKVVPGYMAMGQAGMGDGGSMGMAVPPNSLPMGGGDGPFGPIGMGGMFTILKVRETDEECAHPGWYRAPEGTRAAPPDREAMRRDGIDPDVKDRPS